MVRCLTTWAHLRRLSFTLRAKSLLGGKLFEKKSVTQYQPSLVILSLHVWHTDSLGLEGQRPVSLRCALPRASAPRYPFTFLLCPSVFLVIFLVLLDLFSVFERRFFSALNSYRSGRVFLRGFRLYLTEESLLLSCLSTFLPTRDSLLVLLAKS